MGLAHYSEYDSSRHHNQSLGQGEFMRPHASNGSNSSIVVSEHVLVLYPGQERCLQVGVYEPRGCALVLEPRGFPYHVASLRIEPSQGIAPFMAQAVITANETAPPGLYPWSIQAYYADSMACSGFATIMLIILPQSISAEQYRDLRSMYKSYGIQLSLWYAMNTAYPLGASFSIIKVLYEIIVRAKVSKGTVGNTLSTMLKKGLVEKVEDGIYRAVDMDLEDAIARVDARRVRHREKNTADFMKITFLMDIDLDKLPKEVRQAYNIAQEICFQHGVIAGLYFLLHTLLGVRRTGFLLLWDGREHLFIVCEPKTHLCHYYYSQLLSTLLTELGLAQGIYYPIDNRHEEAKKIVERYIHRYYGGYKSARRLHYILREQGYVGNFYDDQALIVKVYHEDDDIGVDIYDYTGKKKLASYGERTEYVKDIETWIALPLMHIDKRNEETYFYRPAGLY